MYITVKCEVVEPNPDYSLAAVCFDLQVQDLLSVLAFPTNVSEARSVFALVPGSSCPSRAKTLAVFINLG